MKYFRADRFRADYARLSDHERQLFSNAVRTINAAYGDAEGRWPPVWPASLRVKTVTSAPGVWEVTWSFAGPDGRATFEYVTVDEEPAIRWLRIGGHEIFREPR